MSTSNAPVVDTSTTITDVFEAISATLDEVLPAADVRSLSDAELLAATRAVEILGRKVDSLRAHCAGQITERSPKGLGTERLSARNGCRTPAELIARLTGSSEATACRRASLGQAVAVRGSLTGDVLPARFPAVAAALATGEIGEDAARIIVSTLAGVELRAEPADWETAEAELVASAVSGFTADQTRVQAAVWKVALDPDGVDTDAEEAMRRRALIRLGTRDGLVRYRMELMPEISGKLEQAIAAVVSPKSDPVFLDGDAHAERGLDERTSPQKRHDAFASLIDAAARSAEVASMGGAAPTVLVTVDERDLAAGRGAGWIDGVDEPIPMAAITQFACAGGIQKLLIRDGRIVSLWSPERCFTPQQRRAISVRDGGCVITGCRVPAGWCEVHHVLEHSRGGPTHTDNGVTLCWFHHRSIDTGGWSVRMQQGRPQVRAPGWIDPKGQWRNVEPRTVPRR
ncbi:DUF222 domain-containing protein [Rathayibacter sp. KR2-224]|uniref:HNH endonuclease signature motif containing protein n=1 Tax=Rathayibacter sp. KR2-224 TaxID=3400913 RepID=UPI003C020003